MACGERELEHFDLSQFPKTRVQLFHFTVAEGRLKNSKDLFFDYHDDDDDDNNDDDYPIPIVSLYHRKLTHSLTIIMFS